MSAERRILVSFIPTSSSSRSMLRGVGRFARPEKQWTLRLSNVYDEVLPEVRRWQPHGVFANVNTRPACEQLLSLGVPVVDMGYMIKHPRMAAVTQDWHLAGRRAARHLLERGLRQFAFLGFSSSAMTDEMLAGFRAGLGAAGRNCRVNCERDSHGTQVAGWCCLENVLVSWVRSLPKPIGILADRDGYALELESACQIAGIRVPEEVALLGMGDDTVRCSLGRPPLSSVRMDGSRLGYEAATLLERLMDGCVPVREPVRVAPGDVTARQSTDVLAVGQPGLQEAARFIRLHAHEGIGVKEVLASVAIGRRELERGFRRILGRTPLEEIHRVRLGLAKELLQTTDLPIPTIAGRAGFNDWKRMGAAFRRQMGVPPSSYRRQCRLQEMARPA